MPRKKNRTSEPSGGQGIFSEFVNPFKQYLTLKKYDRTLRDYRDKLKTHYSREYDLLVNNVKGRLSDEIYKAGKFDNPYRKRKISAAADTAAEAALKFEDKYPDLCIEDEFSYYCSLYSAMPPDVLDREEYLSLAAALFILDSLEKSGNYYKAVFYIPHNEETEKTELPIDFADSVFSNDVIKGVVYLIKNRHGSSDAFYSPETAAITPDKTIFCEYRKYEMKTDLNEDSDEFAFLNRECNDVTAEHYYNTAQKMTLQEKYYALLSFIRPEIIERAAQRYRDRCSDIIDIVLELSKNRRDEAANISKKAADLLAELENADKNLNKMRKTIESHANYYKMRKPSAGMINPGMGRSIENPENELNLVNEMSACMEKCEKLDYQIQDCTTDLLNLDIELKMQFDEISYGMGCDITKTSFEKVRDIKINNPYEIIFGFLYLIDSGDSIAWIPNLAECVLGYAVQLLPWKSRDNELFFERVDEKIEKRMDSSEEFIPLCERFAEDDDDNYAEEYSLKYTDAYMWVREDLRIDREALHPYNLAQLIYSDSRMVPPRYQQGVYEPVQAFVKSGFTRRQAEIVKFYKCFAESNNEKLDFSRVAITENRIKERSAGGKHAPVAEELSKMLSVKNAEIEELKKKLYAAEKHSAELNKKIDRMHEDSDSENQELLELRNLIYKMQNSMGGEDQEPDKESDISFPYRTGARVVVFGGHATWLKVIVKLLPNVKFIDPYADPDVNTIRNADVVWMQTNAMPHSRYNKIMEIVRLKKIPVKYFAYASAEKCAVQLAEFDLAADK